MNELCNISDVVRNYSAYEHQPNIYNRNPYQKRDKLGSDLIWLNTIENRHRHRPLICCQIQKPRVNDARAEFSLSRISSENFIRPEAKKPHKGTTNIWHFLVIDKTRYAKSLSDHKIWVTMPFCWNICFCVEFFDIHNPPFIIWKLS